MKILVVLIFLFGLSACGVKGKPLPPLEAPKIGDGQINFSEADRADDADEESEEKASSPGTKEP